MDTKQFTVSSLDKTSGSNSNFVVNLSHRLERVNKIYLESIIIPKTWYTIMTGINDQITVRASSTDYVATLTEGFYTASDLATEIGTQLNTAYTPDNNFSVAVSTLTYKYTITHTVTAHTLEFGTLTQSAGKTIGFNPEDTASAVAHTGDNVYNLQYSDKLYILSNALGSDHFKEPNNEVNVIYIMPVTGGFGDFMVYENQGGHYFIKHGYSNTIKKLDFQVVFEDKTTIVPLNGTNVHFTFSYEQEATNPRNGRPD